jgi:hypothetical protein
LFFICEVLISQTLDAHRVLNRTRRHSNYKKALRNPLKTTLLRIKNYPDSVFPNDSVLKFRNIVSLEIDGLDDSIRPPFPALRKLRIDAVKLKQLSQLRCLSIVGFDLSNFPEELCALNELQGLELDICHIKTLPACFSSLSELTYLGLRINELTSLPEEFGQLPKLEHLDIGNNRLISVPVPISRLRSLKRLWLGNAESNKTFLPVEGRPVGLYVNQIDFLGSYETVRLILASGHVWQLSADIGICDDLWLFIGKLRSDHLMGPVVIGKSGCR